MYKCLAFVRPFRKSPFQLVPSNFSPFFRVPYFFHHFQRKPKSFLLFQGHDTSTVTVGWTLFTLSNYPEYQVINIDERNETEVKLINRGGGVTTTEQIPRNDSRWPVLPETCRNCKIMRYIASKIHI